MSALSRILPNPKHEDARPRKLYVEEDEESNISKSTAVVKQNGAPAYGHRQGWIPRAQEDFGDGGAYPEINMAQYPLEMGLKTKKAGAALALQVDADGKIQYDAIAKQGRDAQSSKIIHTSFKDLVPLRNRANAGELSLDRPTEEEVQATADRTNAALQMVVSGQLAASRPKTVKTQRKNEPTYVRYTPANQMGEASDVSHKQRIIKMVDLPEDPLEPPKHRHRKVPRGPGSPPPPIMHSPPRKISAKDQQDWMIPPSISNWKNAKGYTVPLEARLAADGRGLQDTSINDNFAKLSEALYMADRHAREEVRSRSQMQQRIAQREKEKKEEQLRLLAQRAREGRNARSPPRRSRSRSLSSGGSRSVSRSPPRRAGRDRSVSRRRRSHSSSEDENVRERERLRRERRQDAERAMRVGKMGREAQMKHLERENNRDVSEKIALGLAKPTASKEAMYDQRLFNQTAGMDSGFGADDSYNLYDKPLFANREAANAIYKPFQGQQDDEDETVENVTKDARFDVLGRAGQGFKGAEDVEAREGPVQFERDEGEDKFGVTQLLEEAKRANPSRTERDGADAGTASRGDEEAEDNERRRKRNKTVKASKWD
ncbi:protein of unknown function [Taphrina deformans PYCC 5710]|uniref:Pre-mRNA-processing protein 45 n=1 Tax=Taphrina deformans (strain PYCC 5710 / ATCC 11124 / CBS 356.35 / IMI 108563 / JCM 9778 / NBRC 8474) TaxID=1097556 RepID=R4XEV9_TAPDE|nr:protein of unknown function [Taphrina deformans PYCC 5710]|eukprot:CCG84158.1 protein of unknown function [Taphrina deformans PYCC 5710]